MIDEPSILSVFFDGSTPKKLYSDLDLSYIQAPRSEHGELARSEVTDWCRMKNEI